MRKLITNSRWRAIYKAFRKAAVMYDDGYVEALAFSFSFNPDTDAEMSSKVALFDPAKAIKMYYWYKNADKFDDSITELFPEYKNCIDDTHKHFNSNYGIYAYTEGGLKYCVEELIRNRDSRRACFCINSNKVAINDDEIDKLCTNTIHFFIRDDELQMIVQMRSSNFITLLPYDVFMFSIFYDEVYSSLKEIYKTLSIGDICMQIASIHYYKNQLNKILSK